ncbi:MAG: hypothetical protein EOO90_14745 [Pedobacter sp.]|nr:MAG: hypothetical protein EOO90_14745 [Pedobacter sp.]
MKIESLFLFLFFIIIGTNFNASISYVIFGVIVLLFLITRKRILLRATTWDFLALGFILLWMYGLLLGLYLKNRPEYIVANNAGMILYVVYYLLLQIDISKEKIFQTLLYASASIGIITLLIFVFNLLGIPQEIVGLLGESTGGASTGQRRVYFVSQISLFPGLAFFIGVYISSSLQKKQYFNVVKYGEKLKVFLLFLFYTICVALFTASKGFMMGYIFLLFLLPVALFYRGVMNGRLNKKIFFFFGMIIVLFLLLLSLGYVNIITSTFDNKDISNLARYEQLYFIINDLTFWGRGLGSVIPGYARNLDKPYGFELSYFSLVHKFGIIGIFAIIFYLIIIWRAMRNIVKGINVKYALVSLGCITYLLPSIGNPLMFAPQAVVLNSFAIYLLRKKND